MTAIAPRARLRECNGHDRLRDDSLALVAVSGDFTGERGPAERDRGPRAAGSSTLNRFDLIILD